MEGLDSIIEGPLYYGSSATQIMVSYNICTVQYLQSICILQKVDNRTLYGTSLSDQTVLEYVNSRKSQLENVFNDLNPIIDLSVPYKLPISYT